MWRRGQSQVVSVVLLTAVAIALSIGAYTFFQGTLAGMESSVTLPELKYPLRISVAYPRDGNWVALIYNPNDTPVSVGELQSYVTTRNGVVCGVGKAIMADTNVIDPNGAAMVVFGGEINCPAGELVVNVSYRGVESSTTMQTGSAISGEISLSGVSGGSESTGVFGSGEENRIAKWTGSSVLGMSILSDYGNRVDVNGDLNVGGLVTSRRVRTDELNVGIVTIRGDGNVSTNLNADKLDGYDASDLLAAGAGGGGTTLSPVVVEDNLTQISSTVTFSQFLCMEDILNKYFGYSITTSYPGGCLIALDESTLSDNDGDGMKPSWIVPPDTLTMGSSGRPVESLCLELKGEGGTIPGKKSDGTYYTCRNARSWPETIEDVGLDPSTLTDSDGDGLKEVETNSPVPISLDGWQNTECNSWCSANCDIATADTDSDGNPELKISVWDSSCASTFHPMYATYCKNFGTCHAGVVKACVKSRIENGAYPEAKLGIKTPDGQTHWIVNSDNDIVTPECNTFDWPGGDLVVCLHVYNQYTKDTAVSGLFKDLIIACLSDSIVYAKPDLIIYSKSNEMVETVDHI